MRTARITVPQPQEALASVGTIGRTPLPESLLGWPQRLEALWEPQHEQLGAQIST